MTKSRRAVTFLDNSLRFFLMSVLLCACSGDGSGGGSSEDSLFAELDISVEIFTADAPKGGILDAPAPEDGSGDSASDTITLPDGFTLPDGISWPDAVDDSKTEADTDGVSDVGPTDATDATDAGPSEPDVPSIEYDCDDLPEGPFGLTKLDGPMASEDLAFDPYGNIIGSNDKAIFKSGYNEEPQVFVPNMKFRAGLRYLPNGHLIVCNNNKGELVRVDEEGVQHTVLTGLSYPNGLTVDLAGWVYLTEHDANKVLRVHPFTGETTVLTTSIGSPNGVTFSPDYKTLYIGGFSGKKIIYAMSISPDGVPGKLIEWATNVGSGWLDGMAVDACGNVYIADYGTTKILKLPPDGSSWEVFIDGSTLDGAYLPNLQWGSGVGGWSQTSVFLPDGWHKGVFEVDIGVPGKPVPYP
jgi:sugar lactone lactonase YvrE